MRMNSKRSLTITLLTATLMLAGCPKGGIPGGKDLPGGGKIPGGLGGGLDPDACTGLASTDPGRKLRAFLEATKQLDATMQATVDVVKTSCVMMGEELKMAPGDLQGDAKPVCERVITQIRDNMKVAIKPILVGYSRGSQVAILTAASYPDSHSILVLYGFGGLGYSAPGAVAPTAVVRRNSSGRPQRFVTR